MADRAIWLVVLLIAYSVIGTVSMKLWQKRRQKRHPLPSHDADPMSWVTYWLPSLVVLEAYALLGAAMVYAYILFANITLLHSTTASYFILGGAMSIGLFVLLFVALDVFVIAAARRKARRQTLSPLV